MDKETQLRAIYRNYGFNEYSASNHDDCLVFTHEQGYFHNAEIITLTDSAPPRDLIAELEDIGYACTHQAYNSLEEAEQELFHGFFDTQKVRNKLVSLVDTFHKKQEQLLGSSYEYIPGPYDTRGMEYDEDKNIVEAISKRLSKSDSRLIILEAPAGHGKTCTAYAVLNNLLDTEPNKVPLFTELSRNRSARVFRHVLLDEIDRNYPNLPSSIVRDQIQNGRVPLLIDGFDELIDRPPEEENFDDVESMLDTLANLLRDDARALITTRRTALFASEKFNEWVSDVDTDFQVERFILKPPKLSDWLGRQRKEDLMSSDFPITNVRNPVLLSYLNSLTKKEFNASCSDPDTIVENYLSRLLKREQERQDLQMTPEEQKQVFMNLVRDMIDEDYLAEDMHYIRQVVKDTNKQLLSDVTDRYSGQSFLNFEELVDKLLVHAFLDKPGTDQELLEFVNDFILGYLVAQIAIDEGNNEWLAPEPLLDRAVEAFSAVSSEKRQSLYSRLQMAMELIPGQQAFEWELTLRNSIERDYDGTSFKDLSLRDIVLPGEEGSVRNCVFTDCEFHNVTFKQSKIEDVAFTNCSAYSCEIEKTPMDQDIADNTQLQSDQERGGAFIFGTARNFEVFRELAGQNGESTGETLSFDENDADMNKVLRLFFPEEGHQGKQVFSIQELQLEAEGLGESRFEKAVERLCVLGVLKKRGDSVLLDKEKSALIDQILDRN